MGITGSFVQLKELRAAMQRLGTASARVDVSRVVAEQAVKLIDDGFRSSRDPYGRPWPALTSRNGRPLLDTGAHLRASLAPRVSADGFVIQTAFPGAAVHQYGAVIKPKAARALRFRAGGARPRGHGRGQTGAVVFARKVTVPRRQYMPEGDPGPVWGPALKRAAERALRDAMGRR